MQPTCGGGLARFRSAPASWLEAILLKEEDEDEGQNSLTFTQLLSTNNAVSSTSSTPNNNSLFSTSQPQYLPDYYHASSPHTPTAANANNPFTQVLFCCLLIISILFINFIFSSLKYYFGDRTICD